MLCRVILTPLESVLIPTIAGLAGVALGMAGTWLLQWRKDVSDSRQQRDAAIAELLTAIVDLVSAVASIRVAYRHKTTLRHYWYLAARFMSACASVLAGADRSDLPGPDSGSLAKRARLTFMWYGDWRRAGPLLDHLLAIERDLDNAQRTAVFDATSIIAPRTLRYYAAVAVLTLGPDKQVADAVRKLTPAVGALMEVMTAQERKFRRASRRAEKALGEFRRAADQRRG